MYKAGDRVRVKRDLIPGQKYGSITLCEGPMSEMRGKAFKIKNRIELSSPIKLFYEDDGIGFWWSYEMLEPAAEDDEPAYGGEIEDTADNEIEDANETL
jgi:hypothetical protein